MKRPRQPGSPQSAQVGLRFTAEEKAAIEQLASSQHKNPTEFCRDLIMAEVGRLLLVKAGNSQ